MTSSPTTVEIQALIPHSAAELPRGSRSEPLRSSARNRSRRGGPRVRCSSAPGALTFRLLLRRVGGTARCAAPDAEVAWRAVAAVGGRSGWPAYGWLWRVRATARSRGRRHRLPAGTPASLGREGRRHHCDWWRVVAVEPGRRLTLLAEMKVPGAAVLGVRGTSRERRAQPLRDQRHGVFPPRRRLGHALLARAQAGPPSHLPAPRGQSRGAGRADGPSGVRLMTDRAGLARFRRLRRYNLAMALLHGAQGAALLALSNDFTLPVTATFMEGPPGSRPTELTTLFDLPIGPAVAAFVLISATAHAILVLPGVFGWYSGAISSEQERCALDRVLGQRLDHDRADRDAHGHQRRRGAGRALRRQRLDDLLRLGPGAHRPPGRGQPAAVLARLHRRRRPVDRDRRRLPRRDMGRGSC
jgi:hypothetical protein